ncbi:type I DNA topoisomerase [Candidatus Saccharibacteria bacterium]|nr:type I DNA topoisomerase [Candidatus Saccharibacteria bacterium]
MQNLVIVESPAKAKTIEKYLGKNFKVMASVGHIRQDTKVDKKTFDVTYEINPDHNKIIADLKKAAKTAKQVWLATDEDREGEAISWHLVEVLKLPKNTHRITFHEITKSALEQAIKNPRHIDMDMVDSQRARQTLDMLVGYDLSGVVRKKVPGAISAGRVQSPALRLVVEREKEIEKFTSAFSFKVTADFGFPATLDHAFKDEKSAKQFLESLRNAKFTVADIEVNPGTRSPGPPFTTASMQIEASSKLGFSARTTMQAAQALYQAGHITYHRTDSVNLSKQAIASMAHFVESNYGKNYLKVRNFKTKSASAQEAHEAIRPTSVTKETAGKNDYEKRLYALIRNRALATQMADAKLERTVVNITTPTKYIFEAKGEVILFDGFLKVYGKYKDSQLPKLEVGRELHAKEIVARQTFERPPTRYTEGSLVKKLEELGIGRPSTYAGILTALQTRGYVIKGESDGTEREIIELILKPEKTISKNVASAGSRKLSFQVLRQIVLEKTGSDKGKLIPTPIGELISSFLIDNFKNIVDYKFTADLEEELDLVADAALSRVKMLKDFYGPFSKEIAGSDDIERYNGAKSLGKDPKTDKTIYAKIGKNGGFIQLGESEKDSGEKPRFAPLPKGATVKTVTLKQAIEQLALPALPRPLGTAKDGVELIAASGPFGPYLIAGKYNIPLKKHDPYTVTLRQAEPLYQAKLDSMIADWGDIQIIKGAYGPYVKGPGRRNNAKIPEGTDPKKLTKAQAEKILAEKPKSRRRPPKRRNTTKKKSKK